MNILFILVLYHTIKKENYTVQEDDGPGNRNGWFRNIYNVFDFDKGKITESCYHLLMEELNNNLSSNDKVVFSNEFHDKKRN